MNHSWWKWGTPEESLTLEEFPHFISYLEDRWNIKLINRFEHPKGNQPIPPSKISEDRLRSAFNELSPSQVSVHESKRKRASIGRSYHDIIRALNGEKLIYPDFVVFPKSAEEVAYVLSKAAELDFKINTFSGGSNVTGAYEVEDASSIFCSLNMTKMNKLIEIDTVSCTATFEAGIFGPALEKILQEKGFTLGHFPQSFEYSTLGGWIATRSAGQESDMYGKIEDMVLGIKVMTPRGQLEHLDFPRHAAGVDLFPLFIGAEGTLGIITQAKMRIHPIPKDYKWNVALFKDFSSGAEALREAVQAGVHASITRLSDPVETKMLSQMQRKAPSGMKKIIKNQMSKYLISRGYKNPCILMQGFAINNQTDHHQIKSAKYYCKKNGAKILPPSVSSNWEKNRFMLPYLRDPLVQNGILIDTFETITYWKDILPLYRTVFKCLKEKNNFFNKNGLLFCHISHIYLTGASLYLTMMIPQEEGNEVDQWLTLKEVVTDAIIAQGGAISHHHGVGKDHRKWYLQQLHCEESKLLKMVKKHLDPNQLLNPGKLFDEPKE